MARKRHKRTHIRLSSSSCGASLPGRSTSKLLTLTCAEKLSFSFDSCFSLKQNKKKTEKPKLDFYTYSQLGVDTNHLGNFRAQSGYSSDTRKRPRESTGQRFEANFQSCLSLLLNLDQQRKKKTKHLFFFPGFFLPPLFFFLTVWGFQMQKDFTLSWHTLQRVGWGLKHPWKCRVANGCSSKVSHSTFRHPEPAKLPRHFNCSDSNEPIFNFCSALSSQFEASNNQTCRQASAHCRSSGRESPQSGHGHRGKGRAMVFAHWPGFGCLCVDSFPGMQSWAMSWWTSRGEAAHTDTTVLRAPGCHAVLYRTVVAGVPHWQAGTTRQGLTAGRDHTALGALMNTSLQLVIHPG